MNMKKVVTSLIIVISLFFLFGLRSKAETFVIPHILETNERITSTPSTFDTTIFATYSAGLVNSQPSSGATVDLYLFDQATGDLLLSKTDEEVCNPCSFDFDSNSRKQSIGIDDLINEAGGFPRGKNHFSGFAILSTDAPLDDISFDYTIELSQKSKLRTSVIATQHNPSLGTCPQFHKANDNRFQVTLVKAYKLIRFVIDVCDTLFGSEDPPPPVPIPSPTSAPKPPTITNTTEGGRTLGKNAQRISNTTSSQCNKNNFDTTINLFNQSGIEQWVALQETTEPSLHEVGQPIDVDLYLFDDKTSLPVKSATNNEVCNPCRINLGTAETRKRLIRIDDLIREAGGFSKQVLTGFATIVVDGDADNVSIQSFVVNSKSGPFDTPRFGFEIEKLRAPSQ